jgi:dTDP-4-dehydrorhamnose 3,5-epimerase
MSSSGSNSLHIGQEFEGPVKNYVARRPIEGVEVIRLRRFVDDRGFFMEIYRRQANHKGTEELARFFEGIEVAQMNFSIVDAADHIKGLHYHLKQKDIWFCPPPSKMKIVLLDCRQDSPTYRGTQVITAGDGNDVFVKIPEGVAHGYRPLTNPCALLYIVTKTFDLDDPDEFRIAWDHPSVRDLWAVPNG